jgi:MSHA biogenesis protein MshQ
LRETTAGTYTLGVVANSSTPALKAFTQNPSLCSINGSAMSANCAVNFSDAGLLYTVPAQTSGVTSGTIELTAAKADDVSKACVPAFAGVTRNINFWSGYVDPATGTRQLTLNATALSTNAAAPTTLALPFDVNGKASITVNYPDAGRISLNARYAGSAATGDSGLSMPGSATFPVVPYRLCVDSDDATWQCPSASIACPLYRKAGENFRLRVTAKAFASGVTDTCSLPTTPNYRQLGTQLGASVVAPIPGSDGSLGVPSIDIVAGGTATLSAQTQAEVGVFTFTATPAAATHPSYSYFGQTVPSGTSANFGRFHPAGFVVGSGGVLTNRGDLSCATPSGFTYLGEPLNSSFSLYAVNTAGVTTSNYRGAFARLSLVPVAANAWGASTTGIVFGAKDNTSVPTVLNNRVSVTCAGGLCGSWGSSAGAFGTATIAAQLGVSRASTMASNGPFNQAQFGFSARDPDGVSLLSPNYVMHAPPSATAADGVLLGSTVLRWGRMRLENAYGSPVLALPVPATAQFWNGTAFERNADDRCTRIGVPVSVAIGTTTKEAIYCNGGVGLYGTLAGVAASMNGVAAGSVATLSAGQAGLVLSRPSGSSSGFLDLALLVPEYLKFNWDGADQSVNQSVVPASCTTPGDGDLFDDNPRARIRFGIKRNDKVIYAREVY